MYFPHGTSPAKITPNLGEQVDIIKNYMLDMGLNGIEYWHSRHSVETSIDYHNFAKNNGLLISLGSDCHQNPVKIGSVELSENMKDDLFIFQ